ncbi:MAG: serine hydrolase domain-containing protein [Planctomycetota bacterium]
MAEGPNGVVFEGLEPVTTGRLETSDRMLLRSEALKPLHFDRLDVQKTSGYLPGDPGTSATNPLTLNDGWVTAHPDEVGLDIKTLEALLESLSDPSRRSLSTTRVHSVQIARHGKLAVDAYFFGRDAADTYDTRSAGKSVGSLLLGAALGDDGADDLNKPLKDLLQMPIGHDAARVTLGDMIAMRSGLWVDDGDPDSPAEENRVQSSGSSDWYAPVLQAPARHTPGSHFAYSSMSINIAGAVIAQETGRWMPVLLEELLFAPMQIQAYHVNLMPSQDAYLGGGVRVRPRDFLKIGQLVLDDGRWRDHQVVPADWISATTIPLGEVRPGFSYASGWWERVYEIDGRRLKTIQALGNGGQVVVACPELHLAVCFTAGNYGDGRAASKIADELVPEYVLRAALRGNESR